MASSPDLAEWNLQSVALLQAMAGAISPNFRRVTLGHNGIEWVLGFVLEAENAEDREEIEDIGTEWEALQSGPVPVRIETSATADELPLPALPTRVICRRREAVSAL